jgi:hypothetical protein
MPNNIPAARRRVLEKMAKGDFNYNVLADIPSVNFKKELEKSIKLLKEYAKSKNLSKEKTDMLIEAEILSARYGYLYQRNQANSRTRAIESQRDTNANNQEIAYLDAEYLKKEKALGKILSDAKNYVNNQSKSR